VAYVPLAFVSEKHADGTVKGIAIASPRNMDSGPQQRLRAALDQPWKLLLGRLGSISLRRIEDLTLELQSLQFTRYVRRHDCWATVTPIVLDRHPKKHYTAETIIAESCRRIGLPAPVEIHLGPVSAMTGVPRAQDFRGSCKQLDHRKRTHALLRFSTPVHGPVLLGAGRFMGLGLCMPYDAGRARA
jgi:CRISPR-associated protein Csb2